MSYYLNGDIFISKLYHFLYWALQFYNMYRRICWKVLREHLNIIFRTVPVHCKIMQASSLLLRFWWLGPLLYVLNISGNLKNIAEVTDATFCSGFLIRAIKPGVFRTVHSNKKKVNFKYKNSDEGNTSSSKTWKCVDYWKTHKHVLFKMLRSPKQTNPSIDLGTDNQI